MTTPHKWEKGDRFKINPNFSMANDDDDNITGVVEQMDDVKDQEMEVHVVLAAMGKRMGLPEGIVWLLDKGHGYIWRSDWVSPMIAEKL